MSWMVLLAVLWVVVDLLAGFLGRPYSPYQVVWTRYGVHLLLMLALWGWREPRTLWHTRRPLLQIARAMLMVAMPVAVILAMTTGTGYTAVWSGFWVAPLMILAFAWVGLGEQAPVSLWVACVVAVAGTTLLLGGPELPHSASGLVLPLIAAASFSLYVVMTRMLRGEHILANLFYTALGVFVVLTPFVPRLWIMPTGHDLVVLSSIGIIGFCVLYAVDRMASVSTVATSTPIVALQVPFTIGSDAVFAQHIPGMRVWAGACLVVGAAVWTWMRRPVITVVSNP
jgi:drug/metabolite transporter (DMT)-like permease